MSRNVASDTKQELVALLLAQGQTVVDAAKGAGINERTVWRWFKDDPAFASRVGELKAAFLSLARMQLASAASAAIEALRKLLAEGSETARLKAAEAILSRVPELAPANPAGGLWGAILGLIPPPQPAQDDAEPTPPASGSAPPETAPAGRIDAANGVLPWSGEELSDK